MTSPRQTRSRSRQATNLVLSEDGVTNSTKPLSEASKGLSSSQTSVNKIMLLPENLTSRDTNLPLHSLRTLRKKRQWLQVYDISKPTQRPNLQVDVAVQATLVFAQAEAGTAVCVSDAGLILTCAHCIAETKRDLVLSQDHWLIFTSGRTVKSRCIAWNSELDLALLQITAAQAGSDRFAKLSLAQNLPSLRSRLICVGHPGSEDLESVIPGVKTNYDVLYVSAGLFYGYCQDQDILNNREIGALMHTCWTYWGHSGAPLVNANNGALVGLHSSWDDTTGMRRGVGLDAIRNFLGEHAPDLLAVSGH